MAKIAACLIVKNSEQTLEGCLASIRPFVDEINVYDTGSTDGTLDLLDNLAAETRVWLEHATGRIVPAGEIEDGTDGYTELPLAPIRVENGEWRDDFGWARQQSFAMASDDADWYLWLDDDDLVQGAHNLRQLAHTANPAVNGFIVQYDYARDEHGNCVCVLWRERLIRRSAGFRWHGAIHEVLLAPDGTDPGLAQLSGDLVRYIHNRPADRYSPTRNLDILRADEQRHRDQDEPVPPRTLAYLGTELMTKGEWVDAARYLVEYLDHPQVGWSDERMQVHHKLGLCQRMLGHPQAAVETEMLALRERDDWAETYVGLAESFAGLNQWDRVERWAKRAVELGMPRSALILNPLEFTLVPMLRLAEACANQGRFDEADEWLAKAAVAAPGQQVVAERGQQIREMRTTGETVKALLHLREILVRYDENEKAYRLMEAAPYIVADHPAVVKARADQREMVRHFTHPDEYVRWYRDEPKESSLVDDNIDDVGTWFGRVAGLERGLVEQEQELGAKPVLLDLGCNDWWMGEYFARRGVRCDGVELNRRSYDLALERIARFGRDVTVVHGDLHDAKDLLWEAKGAKMDDDPDWPEPVFEGYDAVSLFEVFEHVPDTERTLDVMESLLRPGGRIYLSTPNGAFEQGHLDSWHVVQRKGHLRAIPLHELAEQLMRRGDIEDLEFTNGDRVAFASYTPRRKKGTITFYAGGQWEEWSPASLRQGGIGGSETALVQMATRMAQDGWIVKVYSGATPGLYAGVLYRPFTAWDPSEEVDLLVVSRQPHVFDNPIGARKTALWCHDHSYPEAMTQARAEKIDHVVVLSSWQRDRFARLYPYLEDRLQVIRNGITLNDLDAGRSPRWPNADRGFAKRKPRAVYSSSADRGLDVLLKLWPRIRARAPEAELHVFYGFDTLDSVARINPQLAAYKQAILQMVDEQGGEDGGIFLRGRVGQAELAVEMQQARVLAYPTSFLETSCITAMEARAAGLAIVTSDLGALTETVGDHGHLIGWDGGEDEPFNQTDEYQDEFVGRVAGALTSSKAWTQLHEAALNGVSSLDWENRVSDWAALARRPFASGGIVSNSSMHLVGELGPEQIQPVEQQ